MNRRIIKSLLKNKLNQWTKSIKDENVRKLVEKNTIVTGGCIANMLLNEDIKDFDVYFKNKETTLAVAHYYVNQFNNKKCSKVAIVQDGAKRPVSFKDSESETELTEKEWKNITEDRVKIYIKSRGVAVEDGMEQVFEESFEDAIEAMAEADKTEEGETPKDPYRPVFLSSNAITLSDKIQLIVRFYGEAEEVHKNFDFLHCTNWYDYGTGELVLKPEALECLLNKELKYSGSRYPVCSVIRTRKFIKRGFHINAGQYLKMCFQISQLDLTNIDVLEDQLVGVDSSYFSMLIEGLRAKEENDPSFKVREDYLTSIIDKIF